VFVGPAQISGYVLLHYYAFEREWFEHVAEALAFEDDENEKIDFHMTSITFGLESIKDALDVLGIDYQQAGASKPLGDDGSH
jgi:uncharacterized damage-inducible protein DinB